MAIVGMSRVSGQTLSPTEHLRQSIIDILTTPKGSRRMRPLYGSELPRLVDLPLTKGWISAVQAEVATALASRQDTQGHEYGEPRLRLKTVTVVSVVDGKITLQLSGEYRGDTLSLEVTL